MILEKPQSFELKGNKGYIKLTIHEIFSESQNWNGGFSLRGALYIKYNGLTFCENNFYSSTIIIENFHDNLKQIYNTLCGEASYIPEYDDNLKINIKMIGQGHAEVEIDYSEYSENQLNLSFKFKTDQTFLQESLKNLSDMLKCFNLLMK
ncbi:hypothetical protein M2475_000798 [Breznakia sp. PF5-3]|uniref:WapI family immunity protein n=1 Tax=unclassified Breznakia TaxID=2623764 RepID=UPI002407171C|nr:MULTISPECIES: hypothetical protein [unclassified Breznakia]MDF9824484.1 hypothetical protein [Breznakia sp. PM6-1]MDF9835233.1 hypothetical protein [Breznakia sp. PF5-3]MDF9837439.1 hypothetical protein [Breznakia sp. PFB2-8]MDF9859375.1 hypothetical protein [Breznakia sp. PH5-24]